MTILEMLQKKQELGYSYEKIAELSGVPLGTVQKVFGGITLNPRYETLQALSKIFEEELPPRVKEAFAYQVKKQGEYTVEDTNQLPEDAGVELIDGVIYDLGSPTPLHQLLAAEISEQLKTYIKEKKGNCIVFPASPGVQVDCSNHTEVVPDVVVICDRKKINQKNIFGAPDMLVEVLSPSTKRKDRTIKLKKYMTSGVKEYWVVDPERKNVVVYTPDKETEYNMEIYSFDFKVPVGIFQDECEVDFSEIYEYLKFLYE